MERDSEIRSIRNIATIVGVLYILGDVVGIMGMVMMRPLLDAPDYLGSIFAHQNLAITGALLVLIMGLALAIIPIVVFPVLRRYNETLAVGYVVFRGGLETVTSIALAICWLLLVSLSQSFVQAGAPMAPDYQASGTILLGADQIIAAVTAIVFPISAVMFCYVLYQSRLVPRWISGWGLVTAPLYLAAGLLNLLGIIDPSLAIYGMLVLPLGLQEIVMALWLIFKGFDPSPTARTNNADNVPITIT